MRVAQKNMSMFFYQKFGEVLNYFNTHYICTRARNLQNIFRNSFIAATYFLHKVAFFVAVVAGIDADRSRRPCQVFRGGANCQLSIVNCQFLRPVRVFAPDSVNYSHLYFFNPLYKSKLIQS